MLTKIILPHNVLEKSYIIPRPYTKKAPKESFGAFSVHPKGVEPFILYSENQSNILYKTL